MRVALDTNVLAYAEGVGDAAGCKKAVELVEQFGDCEVLVLRCAVGSTYK